jgi:hypothetical protein
MCKGCVDNSLCNPQTPFCNVNTGLCVGCLQDGDCGNNRKCIPSGGGWKCVDQCMMKSDCKTAGTDCCNKVCVDIMGDDANNCGVCGMVCPVPPNAQSAACKSGVCGLGVCQPGFADCDGQLGNGCEINTNNDVLNCRMCGFRCMFDNASPGCLGGMCRIIGCTGSYADCDGLLLNGCESDTMNDPAHCGGCGNQCMVPNATPRCASGACDIGTCNPGYGNCNMLAVDGCERPLNTISDCGACDRACYVPMNASALCDNNFKCQVACKQGFADCDGDLNNGCETDIFNDPTHCGGCAPTNCMSCTMGNCAMAPPKCNNTQCGTGIDPKSNNKYYICQNNNGVFTVSGTSPGQGFYVNAVCACLGPNLNLTVAKPTSEAFQCHDSNGACPPKQPTSGLAATCSNAGPAEYCAPLDQQSYLVWNCK